MNIVHSKLYQHIEIEEIDYSQFEQMADYIYDNMPTKIISAQYRKNLNAGFFVLVNEAITNKLLEMFATPPESLQPKATEATKKTTKATKEAKEKGKDVPPL